MIFSRGPTVPTARHRRWATSRSDALNSRPLGQHQLGMSGIGEPPAGGVITVRGIGFAGSRSSMLTMVHTTMRAPPGSSSGARRAMEEYSRRSRGSMPDPFNERRNPKEFGSRPFMHDLRADLEDMGDDGRRQRHAMHNRADAAEAEPRRACDAAHPRRRGDRMKEGISSPTQHSPWDDLGS